MNFGFSKLYVNRALRYLLRWKYVAENNVQLPDEYDQIYHDLEPFWGIDPNDLHRIQRNWEAQADSLTIGKDTFDELVSTKNYSLPTSDPSPYGLAGNVHQIMDLLRDVEHFIPPFHATFSPHDNPNLLRDYELKKLALEAAKSGKCTLKIQFLFIETLSTFAPSY